VLADGDTVGGVSIRGGAPATRETDLLDPANLVEVVNAVVLSGGSAFGLDAATGVVRWLEERKIGFRTAAASVPIVVGASLYDLAIGENPRIRPDADCGYRAAEAASAAPARDGSVGAGAGATVGKFGGYGRSMKAGIGSAAIALPDGLVVGAIVAVNASGDIVDPDTGRVLAGARDDKGTLLDLRKMLRSGQPPARRQIGENTTIGVVATNARLTKADAHRMAIMADDGYARAIYPSHTAMDGDAIFSLATGRWDGQAAVSTVGALAADVVAQAIVRAATQATGIAGLPAARDLK
jgi:L-aminopeptidase/D-esterase-like protein